MLIVCGHMCTTTWLYMYYYVSHMLFYYFLSFTYFHWLSLICHLFSLISLLFLTFLTISLFSSQRISSYSICIWTSLYVGLDGRRYYVGLFPIFEIGGFICVQFRYQVLYAGKSYIGNYIGKLYGTIRIIWDYIGKVIWDYGIYMGLYWDYEWWLLVIVYYYDC